MNELKEIPIEKIIPNPSQPRENFDKEELAELTDSIKTLGLINPITLEAKKDRFQIVAGERRWRACKSLGKKTIPAFVKTYNDEGERMVESLIENVQRTNLSPMEKGKYLLKLKELKNISITALAKLTSISRSAITDCIDHYEFAKDTPQLQTVPQKTIRSTIGIEKSERKELVQFIEKKGFSGSFVEEKFAPIYRKSPEDVKKALLNEQIDINQAERISKLKTLDERRESISQHSQIKEVANTVERHVEARAKAKITRASGKQLVQIKQAINSLRTSVTDVLKTIDNTNKQVLKMVPNLLLMDEKQKEQVEEEMDRLINVLEQGLDNSNEVRKKL